MGERAERPDLLHLISFMARSRKLGFFGRRPTGIQGAAGPCLPPLMLIFRPRSVMLTIKGVLIRTPRITTVVILPAQHEMPPPHAAQSAPRRRCMRHPLSFGAFSRQSANGGEVENLGTLTL